MKKLTYTQFVHEVERYHAGDGDINDNTCFGVQCNECPWRDNSDGICSGQNVDTYRIAKEKMISELLDLI